MRTRTRTKATVFYGQDSLDRTQQAQERNGKKIRRQAGGTQSEARLRRFGQTAARCQSDAPGQPLLDERAAPRLFAQIRLLAPHISRGRAQRFDSRRGEGQLVSGLRLRLRLRFKILIWLIQL